MSATQKKAKRMDRLDYLRLCVREVLRERNDGTPEPEELWHLFHEDKYDRSIYEAAKRMEDEMFGVEWDLLCRPPRADDENFHPLFGVERLTLEETAIAERIDITHAEKIEAIRPLRAKREERARLACQRHQERWERDHPNGAETETANSVVSVDWLGWMRDVLAERDEALEELEERRVACKLKREVRHRTFDQLIVEGDLNLAKSLGVRLD